MTTGKFKVLFSETEGFVDLVFFIAVEILKIDESKLSYKMKN